jgi:hypothetical protein
LIIGAAVFLTLVAISVFIVKMSEKGYLGINKTMNVHDKVGLSVKTWAKYSTFPSDDALLEVVWVETKSQHDFPFYPEGTQSLVAQLQSDFSKPPVVRTIVLKPRDFYADSNKGGKIKSLTDLVNAVDEGPPPR